MSLLIHNLHIYLHYNNGKRRRLSKTDLEGCRTFKDACYYIKRFLNNNGYERDKIRFVQGSSNDRPKVSKLNTNIVNHNTEDIEITPNRPIITISVPNTEVQWTENERGEVEDYQQEEYVDIEQPIP